MKKIILSLLSVIMICLAFSACSSNSAAITQKNASAGQTEQSESAQNTFETITDMNEYTLYQNIFYNDQAADYTDKQVTKKGIFAAIYDEYSSVKRYYVWGYADNTKCCDWQWELAVDDESDLPNPGSTVEVSGILKASDSALDGYRIENPEITVTSEFKGSKEDVDMTVLGGTLERVQIMNMQKFPDKFEGKTVAAYGRVETPSAAKSSKYNNMTTPASIQHPYYDNMFSQQFTTNDTVPATGMVIVVKGKYSNGIIADSSVYETTAY